MEFRVGKGSRITGEMLERLVTEKLKAEKINAPDAVICYGYGYVGPKPALNAKCSAMNKFEQGRKLRAELGDEALQLLQGTGPFFHINKYGGKLVARKHHHAKGKDMLLCINERQIERALEKGREYFTPVVESDTEYRAWVYRKRVLAVYEKRLTEPANNRKFGRNRANGFTFHALAAEEIPEAVRRVGIAAVKALNLDFGAVDILGKYKNGNNLDVHATVLEVNTAPGVSDEHRSAIVRLVHRIVRWCANGCPGRTIE